MTITDLDLFDLIVWVAWEKRMIAFPPDPRGNRNRRGLYTAALMALGGVLGYHWAATVGCVILSTIAAMYAIENFWWGAVDEIVLVNEFMLYSDEFKDANKRELTGKVRDVICKYESKDFSVLTRLVASHPSLRDKIANMVDDYLLNLCYEVAYDPERRK